MQAAAGDPEADPEPQPAAEPPSMLWGLDPVFSAFARLYVKDILEMTESTQVPGVYFYNQHPIYKVDVLGIVVSRREREKFFCYGVDDGTGVISCVCWKSELLREEEDPTTGRPPGPRGGFNPTSELRRLKQAWRESCQMEIGDLIRVRGTLKTWRQQREVTASCFYRAADPVMALQIDWMLELPQLYRQCYDQPTPPRGDGRPAHSPLNRATALIKDFISQKSVAKFRPLDVLELLQPLVSIQPPPADNQEPVAGPSGGQQLRQLLKEVLQILMDEGLVYRRVRSQDELYHVTSQDKELLMAVRDVIREDSRREKYAGRGVHVLHVLSAVRQRFSLNVSRGALELVLSALELSSDIISTGGSHYTAV
ncbi:CST complex subunit STN1 isoform 2-T2 [Menidia menidia]